MRAAGVDLYGLTSEPQEVVDATAKEWELDFPLIGRLTNELPRHLASTGVVPVVVTMPDEVHHPKLGDRKRYPHGAVQPALFFVRHSDRAVVFRWAIQPATMNMGGAKDRPQVPAVWQAVRSALDAPAEKLPIDAASLPTSGFCSMLCEAKCCVTPMYCTCCKGCTVQ
eukprot:TRINITY_DN61592_c0_g1_i1.p3 TRINITY_DN61592_c0_g1~~TRINITY_DN61592_c0_g1_i1.p3  ORF type:complete len:168 (+),score=45.82 TRINITY_DN61592_c0_g1_i1:257-760(+)